MRRLSIVAMVALLAGCATVSSDCVVRLPAYTKSEQLDARAALPAAAPIHQRMIEDYGQVRAEHRAACHQR